MFGVCAGAASIALSLMPGYFGIFERERHVKIGGRPPAPVGLELAALEAEELVAPWLPPNAHVGPRRRRRRRVPRQVRPLRARPGMR